MSIIQFRQFVIFSKVGNIKRAPKTWELEDDLETFCRHFRKNERSFNETKYIKICVMLLEFYWGIYIKVKKSACLMFSGTPCNWNHEFRQCYDFWHINLKTGSVPKYVNMFEIATCSKTVLTFRILVYYSLVSNKIVNLYFFFSRHNEQFSARVQFILCTQDIFKDTRISKNWFRFLAQIWHSVSVMGQITGWN